MYRDFYPRVCVSVIFTIENENSHYSFVCCFTRDSKPTNFLNSYSAKIKLMNFNCSFPSRIISNDNFFHI